MKQDFDDVLSELYEECGFWGQFTGELRPAAESSIQSINWLLISLFKFSFLMLKCPKFWRTGEQIEAKLLAIYFTHNQKRSINSWLVYKSDFKSISNKRDADFLIPWGRYHYFCIRKLFSTFFILRASHQSAKYLPWLDEFVRYLAGKQLAVEMFERFNVRAILLANDHSGETRAISRVAKEKGIKRIYTQHASVGAGFPPLDFDLSMLDGTQAMNQYLRSGKIIGLVAFTGRQIPMMPASTPKIFNRRVGIATNSMDSISHFELIIQELFKNKWQIFLRCHPSEHRKGPWERLAKKYQVHFDAGDLETFIDGIDVLIAGVTGTVLDAYLRGVPSVVYVPEQLNSCNTQDYYSYFAMGLSLKLENISAINSILIDAVDRGTDKRIAARFDAGLIFDPVECKNTVLNDFLNWQFCGIERKQNSSEYYKNTQCFHSSAYLKFIDSESNTIV